MPIVCSLIGKLSLNTKFPYLYCGYTIALLEVQFLVKSIERLISNDIEWRIVNYGLPISLLAYKTLPHSMLLYQRKYYWGEARFSSVWHDYQVTLSECFRRLMSIFSSDLESFFSLYSELGTAMTTILSPPEWDQDRPSAIVALMTIRVPHWYLIDWTIIRTTNV